MKYMIYSKKLLMIKKTLFFLILLKTIYDITNDNFLYSHNLFIIYNSINIKYTKRGELFNIIKNTLISLSTLYNIDDNLAPREKYMLIIENIVSIGNIFNFFFDNIIKIKKNKYIPYYFSLLHGLNIYYYKIINKIDKNEIKLLFKNNLINLYNLLQSIEKQLSTNEIGFFNKVIKKYSDNFMLLLLDDNKI